MKRQWKHAILHTVLVLGGLCQGSFALHSFLRALCITNLVGFLLFSEISCVDQIIKRDREHASLHNIYTDCSFCPILARP